MTLEESIRSAVRDEVRKAVREELRAALAEAAPAAADGYLSVEKAAALADVHPDTIRAWVKAGRLPEHRAGRELRVLRSEIVRMLDGGPRQAARSTPEQEASAILQRRHG